MAKKHDSLGNLREQVKKYIGANYDSVEDFCWKKGLNKATVSNFLNAKKDFQVSTLQKIADAMGRRLVIQVKKRTD